jgi:ABC-type lipoprotein export system ATPase subunit
LKSEQKTKEMEIILDALMPIPLASIQHSSDSIWGQKNVLESKRHILLNASSGKGKSTFTMMLVGLRNDYSGRILFDDRDIQTLSADLWKEIRQKRMAVVFQDLQLFPNLSVAENLVLKNRLTDYYTEQEICQMLQQLEIDDKWSQRCGLLSMGQQQRVAIIRSLCQPFEWLLMDEPFSHLDAENSRRAMQMVNERCENAQAGFVLTTLGDKNGIRYDQELML